MAPPHTVGAIGTLAGSYMLHRMSGPAHANGYISVFAFNKETRIDVGFEPRYDLDAGALLGRGTCKQYRTVQDFQAVPFGMSDVRAEKRLGLWSPKMLQPPQWTARVQISSDAIVDRQYLVALTTKGMMVYCGLIAPNNLTTHYRAVVNGHG